MSLLLVESDIVIAYTEAVARLLVQLLDTGLATESVLTAYNTACYELKLHLDAAVKDVCP